MEEKSSIFSSTSFSSRNNGTLTMTGTNIALAEKPKKVIQNMKKSHSQPELPSINEMVNARTRKESTWGISNYSVPK